MKKQDSDRFSFALFSAAVNGDAPRLAELLSQCRPTGNPESVQSALRAQNSRGLGGLRHRLHAKMDPEDYAKTWPGLARGAEGKTALMKAAEGGHADCVQLLLACSDPNAQARNSKSLTSSVPDEIEWQRRDPNNPSNPPEVRPFPNSLDPSRPLSEQIGQLLPISDPYRQSTPSGEGATALMLALRTTSKETLACATLLASRSDLMTQDEQGHLALAYAIKRNNVEAAKMLLPLMSVEQVETIGTGESPSALDLAINTKDAEMVRCISQYVGPLEHSKQGRAAWSQLLEAVRQDAIDRMPIHLIKNNGSALHRARPNPELVLALAPEASATMLEEALEVYAEQPQHTVLLDFHTRKKAQEERLVLEEALSVRSVFGEEEQGGSGVLSRLKSIRNDASSEEWSQHSEGLSVPNPSHRSSKRL